MIEQKLKNQKFGKETEKYKLQDNEYLFPYHYVPYFDSKDGSAARIRMHQNGFEYLCYTKHVVEKIQSITYNNLLEVGCGDGRILNFLNSDRASGVDLSEKGIAFAKVFNPNIEFTVGDAGDINEKYSIVIAIEVLEHIPDELLNSFWNTLYNRCEKNGNIIITVPSVNKQFIKKHFRHYNFDIFSQEIKNAGLNDNLEIVSVEYIYNENNLIKIWKRLTSNKYWIFEPHFLRKRIWNLIWTKLRFGTEKNGYHLCVTLKKI